MTALHWDDRFTPDDRHSADELACRAKPIADELPIITSLIMGRSAVSAPDFCPQKTTVLPIDALELRANFPFEEAFLASAGGSNGMGSD